MENTYDMVRADAPTEPGTALSKANLLTNATAAKLGLNGDTATVNDAFDALSMITGDGAPTAVTAGATGQKYYDGAAHEFYICTGRNGTETLWSRTSRGLYQHLIKAVNTAPTYDAVLSVLCFCSYSAAFSSFADLYSRLGNGADPITLLGIIAYHDNLDNVWSVNSQIRIHPDGAVYCLDMWGLWESYSLTLSGFEDSVIEVTKWIM